MADERTPYYRALGECTSDDDAHQVYTVHMYVHHSHTDRTYSHNWRQQSAIPLSSHLFYDTRVAKLGDVVVEVVAWPEAHVIWVLLQTDGFQWSSVTQQVQHVPGFLPRILFRRPLLLAQSRVWCASVLRSRSEPGLWVWECSTDHCWKQRDTTDTLCPAWAAVRRYVHPASHRPRMRPHSNGWSCSTGVRTRPWGMVVPRVNAVNTLHLSKAPQLLPAESKQRA